MGSLGPAQWTAVVTLKGPTHIALNFTVPIIVSWIIVWQGSVVSLILPSDTLGNLFNIIWIAKPLPLTPHLEFLFCLMIGQQSGGPCYLGCRSLGFGHLVVNCSLNQVMLGGN